jgi:hypothetical protein
MVERFHCQLKEALRSRNYGAAWAAHLPWVLMGLRVVPKEDSGLSSAELVYGQPLRLPGQPTLSTTPVAKGALPTLLSMEVGHPSQVPDQLVGATHVYVRNGPKPSLFSPLYSDPYVLGSEALSLSTPSSAGGQK